MVSARHDAVVALERLEREQERQLQETRAALARLKGVAVVDQDSAVPVTSQEYAELGALDAIRHLMGETKRPMSTRELADGILAKGWRTNSRNPVASIHSTLKNAPREFKRNEHGQWYREPSGAPNKGASAVKRAAR